MIIRQWCDDVSGGTKTPRRDQEEEGNTNEMCRPVAYRYPPSHTIPNTVSSIFSTIIVCPFYLPFVIVFLTILVSNLIRKILHTWRSRFRRLDGRPNMRSR